MDLNNERNVFLKDFVCSEYVDPSLALFPKEYSVSAICIAFGLY